jgi:hypothetical protein
MGYNNVITINRTKLVRYPNALEAKDGTVSSGWSRGYYSPQLRSKRVGADKTVGVVHAIGLSIIIGYLTQHATSSKSGDDDRYKSSRRVRCLHHSQVLKDFSKYFYLFVRD